MRSIFQGRGYYFNDDRASGGKLDEDDLVGCSHCHAPILEIGVFESNLLPPVDAIDALLQAIGAALAGNRTLSGLCDWIEPEAPVTADFEVDGSDDGRWADCAILCTYAVPGTPLA